MIFQPNILRNFLAHLLLVVLNITHIVHDILSQFFVLHLDLKTTHDLLLPWGLHASWVVNLIAVSLGWLASIDSTKWFEQSLIFGITFDHELFLFKIFGLLLRFFQNLTNLALLLRDEPHAGLLLTDGQNLIDMCIVLPLQLSILYCVHTHPIHCADLRHRYLNIIRTNEWMIGIEQYQIRNSPWGCNPVGQNWICCFGAAPGRGRWWSRFQPNSRPALPATKRMKGYAIREIVR